LFSPLTRNNKKLYETMLISTTKEKGYLHENDRDELKYLFIRNRLNDSREK